MQQASAWGTGVPRPNTCSLRGTKQRCTDACQLHLTGHMERHGMAWPQHRALSAVGAPRPPAVPTWLNTR